MTAEELWAELHAHPELSGAEKQTIAILKTFLKNETDLILKEKDGWLYGIHDEGAAKTTVVRADMDALPDGTGGACHRCGHDGHMAMAAGAAAEISGRRTGRNVIFLFQPAEETGAGAERCTALFREQKADLILGCHNLPGYPEGKILLTKGTFACASLGAVLSFAGRSAHAACPEEGINPAFTIARILGGLSRAAEPALYTGRVLTTVVEMKAGERNFGIAAGNGELCLTLRAENDRDLQLLLSGMTDLGRREAAKDGVGMTVSLQDRFPATVNDPALAESLFSFAENAGLPVGYLAEPMRWSEDFGRYLQEKRGLFFGIGAGEDCPGLHTEGYVFPHGLIRRGIRIWEKLLMNW